MLAEGSPEELGQAVAGLRWLLESGSVGLVPRAPLAWIAPPREGGCVMFESDGLFAGRRRADVTRIRHFLAVSCTRLRRPSQLIKQIEKFLFARCASYTPKPKFKPDGEKLGCTASCGSCIGWLREIETDPSRWSHGWLHGHHQLTPAPTSRTIVNLSQRRSALTSDDSSSSWLKSGSTSRPDVRILELVAKARGERCSTHLRGPVSSLRLWSALTNGASSASRAPADMPRLIKDNNLTSDRTDAHSYKLIK